MHCSLASYSPAVVQGAACAEACRRALRRKTAACCLHGLSAVAGRGGGLGVNPLETAIAACPVQPARFPRHRGHDPPGRKATAAAGTVYTNAAGREWRGGGGGGGGGGGAE